MGSSTAELTLIIRAQNLADAELAKLRGSMQKVTGTARQVAGDVANAFKGIGRRIGREFSNLAQDIISGGSVEQDLLMLGATLAGAIVEGISVTLVPMILSRVLATAAFAPVAAALAEGGVTLGAVFSTAIAVGMAAFPFVLLAAAVAAFVYLLYNPEVRDKIRDFAIMVLQKISDGLFALIALVGDIFRRAFLAAAKISHDFVINIAQFIKDLPKMIVSLISDIPNLFRQVFGFVLDIAKRIVGTIIDVILAIPRAVGTAIDALNHLDKIDFGSLPGGPGKPSNHATGGWVGLHGPELSWLGERGPEYVVPHDQLGRRAAPVAAGVTIVGVTERQIVDMVDRGLYFRLQRSAPTLGRT